MPTCDGSIATDVAPTAISALQPTELCALALAVAMDRIAAAIAARPAKRLSQGRRGFCRWWRRFGTMGSPSATVVHNLQSAGGWASRCAGLEEPEGRPCSRARGKKTPLNGGATVVLVGFFASKLKLRPRFGSLPRSCPPCQVAHVRHVAINSLLLHVFQALHVAADDI